MENQATLFSFVPENQVCKEKEPIKEPTEDEKIMELLGRFSADMLLEGMRECHPKPEWGGNDEDDCCNTWRFYYMDECRRRGLRLLEQLGWSTDKDSLYVNIHTGSVERLIDIATQTQYNKTSIADQVWSIIEHCEPYDPNKPNLHRIEYVKREIERLKKLLANKEMSKTEIKSDRNRLKEYEAELEGLLSG